MLLSCKIQKASRIFEYFVFFSATNTASHMTLPVLYSLHKRVFFEYFYFIYLNLFNIVTQTDHVI